ncbi:MAG: branched-chain-amino-acid transaminase [Cytophagales bacterium]|nr:branched-chain-amino-acid transaminase [Bernardetiaceae bacterium]MDW8204858.1 branched-chain-amino-acid transaminase [Cytophagales bacterium]
MYYNDKTVSFFDGKFVKSKEIAISPFAQTLHYGLGVFEGLKAYQTQHGVRIFKPTEHFTRMKKTAEALHLPFDYDIAELEEIAYELLERNKFKNAYIRPILIAADNMGLLTGGDTKLFMATWKWPRYLGDRLLNTCISSYRRIHAQSLPVVGKITGCYVPNIMASTDAKQRGFDEAIMLDENGYVAQAPGSNIFIEKEGVLITPPLGNIMPGITRATVIEIAKSLKIEVFERVITIEELLEADAAIFTGTATEIVGIASVEGTALKLLFDKSQCARIAEAYNELVHSVHEPAYTII